ncbi:TonB-dependent receptor plug domain-containing protein [Hymenobacter actinosclerus]|uniref:TonB-dependent outer membrane receptor, SusC/RagA subfamily, signature region n=1 Tax=Hymenobacter actinosclerus TaxID=82805 RepID=A0A1H9ZGH0_9BACT|nr:TonB-dependent receptor plug domain-containing protein [Hymenobacter actinosclerus]SES80686.1 TonB-dependent outer membrane receptor, SusC/RagA subfamily, signature region [Hymenobacter actinosclerus]
MIDSYLRRAVGVAGLLVAALAAGLTASGFRPLPDPTLLARRLADFYRSAQPEVSYLHLDQDAYAAGETMWFKAYLLDSHAHQPDSLSKVLYVDLVAPDRRILFKRTLALTDGQVAGDIILPDTLSSGVYTVRAYTSWMRNAGGGLFFTRRVPVWQASAPVSTSTEPSALRQAQLARQASRALIAATKPDVQFFPEGGDYVAGLQTTVGVKAVEASGRGLALAGVVMDGNKQEVARFQTPVLGMSSFGFTPQAGQEYEARVTLPDGSTGTYPLPAVKASGWVLNVREVGNEFRVFVRYQPPAGAPAAPAPLQLLAHVRGRPVYAGQGQISPGQTFQANIATTNAPAGLLHITLFDGTNMAQAERLVFVAETKPLQVHLRPDKATYAPRERVSLEVVVSTADGRPAPAELSVAVAGINGLPTEAGDLTNVRAHLLLTSELSGYVENPAFYFQPGTPARQRALDDLLLTQGWSRFVWQQVLGEPGAVAAGYRFPLERTLTLGGRLVRGSDKPVPNGELTLFLDQQKGEKKDQRKDILISQADANANFLFVGFPGLDSTRVLLQARTPKGSSNVLLQLNEWWPRPAPASWHPPTPLSPAVLASPPVVAYGARSSRQQQLERIYRPDSTSGIVLRNVDITGKNPDDEPFSLHKGLTTSVLRTSDIPGANGYRNVFELMQGRLPGVGVLNNGTTYNVVVRGMSTITGKRQPLYLLNGLELPDGEALLSIPVSEIERIEVLKYAGAAMYGVRGANGVIAVYTKRGSGDYSDVPAAGVAVRQLPAYYRAREFYAPHYDAGRKADKPDPRATTLYWQPRLTVPASGRARISFYAADQAGAFRASIEGVSLAGQPATAEALLTVAGQP